MKKPLLLAALAASSLTVSAQVLMVDFGPTAVVNATNSPYHTAKSGFTDAVWNGVTNVDPSSTLNYSNGTPATGISINLGGSKVDAAPDLNTILLATQPTGSGLGSQTNTGVYGGTAALDGIFHTSKSTSNVANIGSVGLQITGLQAGTYEIYLTGRNTNLSSTSFPNSTVQTITAYAGAGTAGADFSFGSYASGSNTFSSTGSYTGSWVQGENYIKLTVTLANGQALNIASSGALSTAGGTTKEQRGFINSLQIVAIPEPSSYAAVVGAFAVSAAALRRRRRA